MKKSDNLITGLVIGALLSGLFVFFFMQQSQKQLTAILEHQKVQLAEADARSGLVNLMSNVLDIVSKELKDNPERTLSDETIERIAALNYAFKPYTEFIGDSLSDTKLSPERGQLLLMLSKMNIDPVTLKKIFSGTKFINADLRGADLKRANLSGIDLRGAFLRDTKLQYADLSKANLSYANLWGADLTNANLDSITLKRATLKWAVFNNANFENANLNGADLSSAQMRRINFPNGTMIWADATGAMLNDAYLGNMQLVGTNFSKANLSNAVMCETNMTRVNLTGTNVNQTDFTRAEINGVDVAEKNWIALLKPWNVEGVDSIQLKYKIGKAPGKSAESYRLERK